MRISRIFHVIGWRAWYDNGAVYDSTMTRWEDLPATGLQIVMQYLDEPGYRSVVMGQDIYYFDHVTNKIKGWKQSIAELPVEIKREAVKTGSWMNDGGYRAIKTAAFRSKNL